MKTLFLATCAWAIATALQEDNFRGHLDLDDECSRGMDAEACSLNALQLSIREPAGNSSETDTQVVRILHLSDTHNLHNTIEPLFPLPPADILIHTGDFTNSGNDTEFASANQWLGKLQGRYKHIIAILGNHDWILPERIEAAKTSDFSYWKSRLSNAHLLFADSVLVMGLKIFGSSWKPGQNFAHPQGIDKVPNGIDILLTHGPAFGILDWCMENWGSSQPLLEDIQLAKPQVHLFGHDHEQRGLWTKQAAGYVGGAEYCGRDGKSYPTAAPPENYSVQLISNNAMMNQPRLEGHSHARIAGPARLIVATRREEMWHFTAQDYLDASVKEKISCVA